jgi:hypothetical protein
VSEPGLDPVNLPLSGRSGRVDSRSPPKDLMGRKVVRSDPRWITYAACRERTPCGRSEVTPVVAERLPVEQPRT